MNSKHHYFSVYGALFHYVDPMKGLKAPPLKEILVLFSGSGSQKLHTAHTCFHSAIAICAMQKQAFLGS
ncbi:hypothetical protein RBA41_27290 [Massilia sp. CCM 9210]|uniref:hypothetical protein n=1 Tax=Massilia scottii TaxID=3057166 RepID=UPI002796AB6B|nr:hypothetical protein [Massilia sp. CCM 9210]MDQ1817016.1 hypothetical protein [Massilia sp. CCM 9210]